MESRRLGKTGLTVSEISFRAWQLGNRHDFEPMDDGTAVRLLVAPSGRHRPRGWSVCEVRPV